MKINKLITLVLTLLVLVSCTKEVLTYKDNNTQCESIYTSSNAKLSLGISTVVSLQKVPRVVHIIVHILYNQDIQNISNVQLQSQLVVLNKCFSIVDTLNVPKVFRAITGNPNITFVLDSIIKKYTNKVSFSSDGSVCFDSLGGSNTLDPNKYLNIWICNKSGAAGYSSYPWSGSTKSDGIIIGYNYIGTTGVFTNNWNYQGGKTLVHEVGHYFGLIHIWGDQVCGSDLVDDTPIQERANGSCPIFPHITSCSPNISGDMFMNFMDYTNDNCRTMFSIGQGSRMNYYLSAYRVKLIR